MLNIICAISVMVNIGGIGLSSKTNLKGKIVSESRSQYLVDFSSEAKKKDFLGDYSEVLVDRDKCVPLDLK